jgi:hypothetical protein
VGTLVYQLKPEADFNDMQDAYIKGTSVALVVLGLIYFALVSRARHAPCPQALPRLDHHHVSLLWTSLTAL